MTTNRIDSIRRRLAERTSGKWTADGTIVWYDEINSGVSVADAGNDRDARLIAHAPDDLEWLLARCDRLEKALRYIQNAYGDPFAEDVVTTEAREALKE